MVTKYQKEFSDFKERLSSALAKDTNYVTNKIHRIVEKTDQGVDTLSMYLSIHIYTGTERHL